MGSKSKQMQPTINGRARAVAWALPSITQWQRDCIVAAGGDPSVVPDTSFRFVRLPEVKQLTGLSRSSIYRLMGEHRFPAPVVLGAESQREGV
jgi:predicted DNA-binding transcriptional regulator AlpA